MTVVLSRQVVSTMNPVPFLQIKVLQLKLYHDEYDVPQLVRPVDTSCGEQTMLVAKPFHSL